MESIVLDRDLKKNTVFQNHVNWNVTVQVNWYGYLITMSRIQIIDKYHLFTYVNIANEYIFSNHHYQGPTTIGPPLPPQEPLLCPNGYKLYPINQCICVENEKYAYQYENVNSVINQYECREQCETRLGCQYYEYNDTHTQCDVWNSNEAIDHNPSVLWSHGLSNCSARKGNLHNVALIHNNST